MSKLRVYDVEPANFSFAIFEAAPAAIGLDETAFRFAQRCDAIEWSVEWSPEAKLEPWVAAVEARPHTRATLLAREPARLGDRDAAGAVFEIVEEGAEVHGDVVLPDDGGEHLLTALCAPHRGRFVLAVVRRPRESGAAEESELFQSFRWR